MDKRALPNIDLRQNGNVETAAFAMGWFWGPDAQFGILNGVIRTRVGYAGGEKDNPTYRNLGDHTETIEIDFDPEIISYEDLSNIYWNSHNSCHKPYSRQYMSIVFYHNEKQRKIAEEMKKSIEEKYKEKSYTEIVPYTKFYMAENYHQKYYLQLIKPLMSDFNEIYPNFKDFVNSTSAARINGYVKGYGGIEALREDIDGFGLSEKGRKALIDVVEGYGI